MPKLELSSNIDDNTKDLIDQFLNSTSNCGFIQYHRAKRSIKRKANFQKFLVRYNSKLNKNKDKYILPPNALVGRYLETPDFYFEDDTINNLFANLLSAASNRDTLSQAHPSYVSIIKEFSPYDAKLLNDIICKKNNFPIAKIRIQVDSGGLPSSDNIPDSFKSLATGEDQFTNCFHCPINDYYDMVLTSISINNLERLGILKVDYSVAYTEGQIYQEIADDPSIKQALSEYKKELILKSEKDDFYNNSIVCLIPGILFITEYGKDFISVCCD